MKYIGATTQGVQTRINEHMRKENSAVYDDLNKYGLDNFNVKVIDTAKDINELMDMEYYYVIKYNSLYPNGYNQCLGGGTTKGYRHTEEAKRKMSTTKKAKGSMVGEKNHFYGKQHTAETRQRMKESWTEERRLKASEHSKNIDRSYIMKKVINLDTLEVFDSIKQAADWAGVSDSNISAVCRGKSKTSGGYRWGYYTN